MNYFNSNSHENGKEENAHEGDRRMTSNGKEKRESQEEDEHVALLEMQSFDGFIYLFICV